MVDRSRDHSKYQNWIDPNILIPYERNAKIHTPEQIDDIALSIKKYGWQQDVVITRDNVLVIGHGRQQAAILLGCEIPYHVVDKTADELTDEEIRELRIIDNKTNESGWEHSILDLEIEDLDFGDFNLDLNEGQREEPNFDGLFGEAPPKEPEEPRQIQCPHCMMWFTP